MIKIDNEVISMGFESIFPVLAGSRSVFIMLLKREKFDYTESNKQLWQDETVESLYLNKAQRAWEDSH